MIFIEKRSEPKKDKLAENDPIITQKLDNLIKMHCLQSTFQMWKQIKSWLYNFKKLSAFCILLLLEFSHIPHNHHT